MRFRQIVAANAILRVAEQRAAYDRLLQLERQRLRSKWTRIIISEAFAVAVLAVALVGGYALFAPVATTAVVAVNEVEDTSTAVAAVKADMENVGGQAETAAAQQAAQTNTTDQNETRHKRDGAEVPNGVMEPSATASATNSGDAAGANSDDNQIIANRGSAPGLPHNDAKFHREQGLVSYRGSDFPRAIVDFDEAIRLDPNDARAYRIRSNAGMK